MSVTLIKPKEDVAVVTGKLPKHMFLKEKGTKNHYPINEVFDIYRGRRDQLSNGVVITPQKASVILSTYKKYMYSRITMNLEGLFNTCNRYAQCVEAFQDLSIVSLDVLSEKVRAGREGYINELVASKGFNTSLGLETREEIIEELRWCKTWMQKSKAQFIFYYNSSLVFDSNPNQFRRWFNEKQFQLDTKLTNRFTSYADFIEYNESSYKKAHDIAEEISAPRILQ